MSENLTITFAGDESGDVSFSFSKGASRFFVVTVIGASAPDDLRNVLAKVRKEASLPQTYEFRFHTLTSSRLRKRVFSALGTAEFEAWALIVDKTSLPEPFSLFMSGLDVYLYFVSEVIQRIPSEKRAGAILILDEFGDPYETRQELKRVLKARGIKHGFHRISVRRSNSEPLIQVADLIAGSIMHRDASDKTEAFDSIASKIVDLTDYH